MPTDKRNQQAYIFHIYLINNSDFVLFLQSLTLSHPAHHLCFKPIPFDIFLCFSKTVLFFLQIGISNKIRRKCNPCRK